MARPYRIAALIPFLFVLCAGFASAETFIDLTAEQPFVDVSIQAGMLDVIAHSDQPCSQVTIDPYLILLDASGNTVAQNDDGAHNSLTDCVASRLQYQIPDNGWTLRVTACCGRLYGRVRLSSVPIATTTTVAPETTTTVSTTTSTSTTTTTSTTTSSTTSTTVPVVTTVFETTTTSTEETTTTVVQTTQPPETTVIETTTTHQTDPTTTVAIVATVVQPPTVAPEPTFDLPPAPTPETTTTPPDQSTTTSSAVPSTTSTTVATTVVTHRGLKSARLISNGLRKGVTPEQQRAVVAAAVLIAMPSPISVARRKAR